jgi:hypothetical protein
MLISTPLGPSASITSRFTMCRVCSFRGAGHHQDVAFGSQFNHRGAIRAVGVCLLCSLVVVHRTVKCFHSLGNSKPYPTQPNGANFLATELQTMTIKISSENHVALNKGSFTNVM